MKNNILKKISIRPATVVSLENWINYAFIFHCLTLNLKSLVNIELVQILLPRARVLTPPPVWMSSSVPLVVWISLPLCR